MSAAQPEWDEVLGTVESELDRAERLLADGHLEDLAGLRTLSGVAASSGRGVLPITLAVRAALALRRTDALARAVEEKMVETEDELRSATEATHRPRDRRDPAYLDARA